MNKKVAVIILPLFLLGACSTLNNQQVGTMSGGAIGGLIGSQFGEGNTAKEAAVGAGVLTGGLIGGAIGSYMDKLSELKVQQAMQYRSPTSWVDPGNGGSYEVFPSSSYYENDEPCRDFTERAMIGYKLQTVYGRACRMSDGIWKIIQ